eukprot:CAMPEP_0116551972 /NCGR_PEP_ID=MMETSP0397-20121206/6239_1 /TAXON_ID=216820 /ORGANISM="Cyclophora tenuis, Strain ECT3854" /LENGTH=92 /DNA_ID=CAMNT_0004076893 /DNA_START=41 /DNA_END=319 /DNA_ORIENTATION=+
MSFASDIMAPGGGVLLLPFIRVVVGLLLFCTVATFIAGVARVHMAILSFLSAGLLFSLQMFETAYNNIKGNNVAGPGSNKTAPVVKAPGKTD